MTKKIIAIGGGEIGRPGYPIETTLIDLEIIKLSNKKTPKLLFIPTASDDNEGYCNVAKEYFGGQLKCEVNILYLVSRKPNLGQIREMILGSDIIYVGGGNTEMLMKIWDESGTSNILRQAYEKGIVLSGLSAGAICWFKLGHSDSAKMNNQNKGFITVRGLNLVDGLLCPHYDFEKDRREDLKKMMEHTSGVAIALDNCCAIEIIDNKFRILSSRDSTHAYRVFWKDNQYFEEKIEEIKEFKPLEKLLKHKV